MSKTATNELSPDPLQQARGLVENKDYKAAKSLLEQAFQNDPTAPIAHELGMIHYYLGDSQSAIQYLDVAARTDPAHIISYEKAAEILEEEDLLDLAMSCYASAMAVKSDDIIIKEKFLRIVAACRFSGPAPHITHLCLHCLETPRIDFSHMGHAWFSLLKQEPDFKKFLKKKDFASFKKAFFKLDNFGILLLPLFTLAMKKQMRVADMDFEVFIKNLRRALLEMLIEKKARPEGFIALAEATAFYCSHTEYIFDTTDEEVRKVSDLRESPLTEESLVILASYMPLHVLENAEELETKFAESAISDLIKDQITDHRRLKEIMKSITSLTETRNQISRKVREQYEESPYPRWVGYAKTMFDENIAGSLRGREANILVAGCGTGYEAIQLAHVFPDSKVLAIDLSYASLAYGIKMAETYDIGNVEFKQADILELGTLDQKFDYIACSGVLHHMEDPQAGWRVITGLLKPGGFMCLCLYSRTARQSITAASETIKKKGYTAAADDIRRFREDAPKILKSNDYKMISSYHDFYSLSECRDMLFHVQEHLFDLAEIKAWLDEAGMEFLGMLTGKKTKKTYRTMFPHDPQGKNINLWAELEAKHPTAFIGMYKVWMRKK